RAPGGDATRPGRECLETAGQRPLSGELRPFYCGEGERLRRTKRTNPIDAQLMRERAAWSRSDR
ncbi:MAG TPA: hypothetical protein VHR72_07885, partial [Gemmataceae bacterium]|nr:hypothetical protein [Gemmataceae bacterium]